MTYFFRNGAEAIQGPEFGGKTLACPINAKGLTGEQFARAPEAAYKAEAIYSSPAIEEEALKGKIAGKGPDGLNANRLANLRQKQLHAFRGEGRVRRGPI